MPQTPQQKRANGKYAKVEEKKRGKPVDITKKAKEGKGKLPISTFWIGIACCARWLTNAQ